MITVGHTLSTAAPVAAALLLTACVATAPTAPGPSAPPAPAGMPSGSPPPPGPSTTGTSRETKDPGTATTTAGTTPGSADQKQQQDQETTAQGQGQGQEPAEQAERQASAAAATGDRTDAEILAEALREFEKSRAGQDAVTQDEAPPGVPAGSEKTDAEQAEDLHGDLNEKFASFDRLMLSERESLKRESDREGSGLSPIGSDDAFGGEGDESGDLQTAMIDRKPPPRNTTQKKSGEYDLEENVNSESIPEDLVSTAGDDIIARQLREAAMKEKDPELREKLWDEYRTYKNSL